ncbi:MAG: prepilin-type N-terminal cleavage/methylation domain-containing protein [Nitrospiraceae bacterium]|nr:prepilin-type N-terminal cleavage/methylation domain-containing protein [Nitrospiraceae bacterium]
MKGQGGFTLIELLIVVAILAIMASIGFSLDGWENKFRAESTVKQAYSDIMKAREAAVTEKRMVFVTFTPTGYKAYVDTFPLPDGSGALNTAQDALIVNTTISGQVKMQQYPGQITISPDGLLASGSNNIYFYSPKQPQLNCITWTATSMSLGLWTAPNCVTN